MTGKNIKCILLILLAVILASGMLNGCKGKGEKEGEKSARGSSAKGRYVEEDIKLPLEAGERAISLTKSTEGNPVVFVSIMDTDIKRCEYVNGKWEEKALGWLKKVYGKDTVRPVSVTETKDGEQLVVGLDDNLKTSIARSADGQSGEALKIPFLEKKTKLGYPTIINAAVDGGGNYWLQDIYLSKITVVSSDTLETKEELACMSSDMDSQRMIFEGEDGTVAINTEDGDYTIYNKELKPQGKLSIGQTENSQICGGEKNWYMVSEEGIVRMKTGDEGREVIMDGSMGTMGSPSNSVKGILQGKDTEFYVLYEQSKAGTYSLAHYVYDKDVAAVPEHTLQVFGLSDSDMIRQAAVGFQRENPDVKIEFKTSGKKAGEVTSDDIRTLNTELLSGKGADILLLNGLPSEAYIEKGILCDLSKLLKGILKENTYLESIMKNTVEKDGKIYGIPVKFSVPVIYGDEKIEKALDTMDSLRAYMDKNPEAAIFGVTNKAYIRDFLFQMYQDELIKKDGSVDKEKMETLLKLSVDIAKNSKTDFFEGVDMEIGEDTLFSNPGSLYLVKHQDMAATDRLSCLANMMVPCKIARTQKVPLKSLKSYYIPQDIAGINKNTEQKKIAEKFVKYLFSEEVQGAQLDDGFPVLSAALEEKEKETESEYAVSSSVSVGGELAGEEYSIDAGYPKAEEVKDFVELCKTLERPANQDRAVWSIYQSEADKVLDGSAKAAQGAENIKKKVELYLAE